MTNISLIDPYHTRVSLLIYSGFRDDYSGDKQQISCRLDDWLGCNPRVVQLCIKMRGHEHFKDKIPQTDLLPKSLSLASNVAGVRHKKHSLVSTDTFENKKLFILIYIYKLKYA